MADFFKHFAQLTIAALDQLHFKPGVLARAKKTDRGRRSHHAPLSRFACAFDHHAASKLLRKLLKRQGFAPTVIVTDRLRSYRAALRLIGFSGRHEEGLRANTRAENSHQPVRRRERKMQGFKSPASAQRFVSLHAAVYNIFNARRHLIRRSTLRRFRAEAHQALERRDCCGLIAAVHKGTAPDLS